MTTTTAKPADAIRAALKARGISRRQVSVVHDHYSMGSSIRVRIRDAAVRLSVVKEIANAHERVDYDRATGEILSGGNRFVDVAYDEAALAPLTAELLPALQALRPDGTVADLCIGFRAFITRQQPDRVIILDQSGREVVNCYDVRYAARLLAEQIADGPDTR